jgi:AGCS family alanine or glycine:cation symporter
MQTITLAMSVDDIIGKVQNAVWGWPLIILILAAGVWLTVRTGFVQVRHLGKALKFMVKNEDNGEGEVTSFGALCTALSATIGTGNIVGVATAICLGGPGALLWMLLAAFFGMATKYSEGFLAIKYREKKDDSHYLGGPFYYIEKGMGSKWKWLAKLFAVFGICVGLFGIGTFTQINGIATAVQDFFDPESAHVAFTLFGNDYTWATVIGGLVVTLCVALVVLGGIQRIAKVSQVIVPFMAITYVVFALVIVLGHITAIPAAVKLICQSAFDPQAALGAATGVTIKLAMQKGIGRGIFSNEAGLGTGSIAHACADTKKPVKQGMFGIFEVFADTIVICTLTAMVILCSGTTVNYGTAAGAELTISGFTTTYGGWASIFTAVALCCFAFSTIIGWGLYGSRFLVFLCRSDKVAKPFFLVYSFVSILGATMDLGLLWSIADTFNGLMSIPNLLALLLLSGTVVRLTREFFASEG